MAHGAVSATTTFLAFLPLVPSLQQLFPCVEATMRRSPKNMPTAMTANTMRFAGLSKSLMRSPFK